MKKTNAAIAYLTRERDLWLLRTSIRLLFLNFNKEHDYTVIVFHDDLTPVTISNLLVTLSLDLGYTPKLNFEKLQFVLPEEVSTDPSRYTLSLTTFPIGYRHMCRFYAGQIFNHPALLPYKFYMRLDSDSFILSKPKKDPFVHMEENGYQYAFMEKEELDAPWACEGLWDCTKEFIDTNLDRISNPPTAWNGELYNTNFEIADMSFFREKNYQDYFNHVDSTRNIYYKRWGDHCIRWLGMRLFMKPENILCIEDFCYQHGGDVRNIQYADRSSIDLEPEPFKRCILEKLGAAKI